MIKKLPVFFPFNFLYTLDKKQTNNTNKRKQDDKQKTKRH